MKQPTSSITRVKKTVNKIFGFILNTIIILGMMTFIIGVILVWSGNLTDTSHIKKKLNNITYKFSDIIGFGNNKNHDYLELKADINNYLKDKKGTYGIYFKNIKTNDEFGIKDEEAFNAASTVKVPLNLFVFKKVENGEMNFNDKLTYTEQFFEEGTGIIQEEEFGKEYTIEELSKLSIEVSDNCATNMLLNHIGGTATLKDYMRKLGGRVVDNSENTTSPKDMGIYIQQVYEYNNVNKIYGGKLIEYMKNTVFNDRITKYLPKNVEVAHKIGTFDNVYNDVGIVYTKDPYILCLMSKDILNEDDGLENLAQISKMVYNFQINN